MTEAIEDKSFAVTVTRGNLMAAMKLVCQVLKENILNPEQQAKLQKRKRSRAYLGEIASLQKDNGRCHSPL
jgi:hypothetical protein